MEPVANSFHGLSQGVPSAHLGSISKTSSQAQFTQQPFSFVPSRAPRQPQKKKLGIVNAGISKHNAVYRKDDNSSGLEYLELMKQEGMLGDHQDVKNILQVAELDVKTLTAAASERCMRLLYLCCRT
ncbi:hypothetical protein GOP47_0019917 [Adiantum capillus-veneris]|uniref:Uncharacterized protein n=1 Tax=Adiantum capillus-veneris TaxID=13818 RepID=A0A9D4UCF5_ADICA|nr:hypothetical protein GOP47_0019917 [Adiantum capillus-veneris]